MFLLGLTIGLIIGANVGLFYFAMCNAAKED